MHTGSLRKWALALSFWLALHMSSLKAQIFSNDLPLQAVTTGTNPVDFEFRDDGTLIAKGNYGVGTLGSGDQGDGTRMLWFPSSGSFRAGTVSTGLSVGSGPWDAANIGQDSVAFGYNTTASGPYCAAFGYGTVSAYSYNLAAGLGSEAIGQASVAMGNYCYAPGAQGIALGMYSSAMGRDAVALGGFDGAWGVASVAMGGASTASGNYSTCSGNLDTASGYASSATGCHTTAAASLSFVLGTYNIGGGDPNNWVGTDPLFEIGNGGDGAGDGNPTASAASDALVVYKNGNAVLQGSLQVAPGGDIPMYTGE